MFNQTAINFNEYFWTPYSFAVLILIGLMESLLFYKYLPDNSAIITFRHVLFIVVLNNVASFFAAYYLSIFLNGGHRTLVWIPWVKIISNYDIILYLISFPIVFVFTVLSEFLFAATLLKRKYHWRQIFKSVFLTNLISTLFLIFVFNCIVFNIVKGQEEGYWDDFLPEIEKQM